MLFFPITFYPLLKTVTVWCTEADFRNGTSRRKAHDDHNVINDTAIIVGISFYILVPDGQNRYCQFLFYHHHIAENTAGCRTRQACPYVCDYFWLSLFFPAFKPTCLPLPCRAMANKSVFRQCAAGGTPVTASHAHMTMTVTGLPSRWQESGAFPLYRCAAPCLFPWRVAPSYPLPFPFRLSVCPKFSCAAFRTASVCHFRCWGKGKDGIRNTNFLSKNLHALSGVVFYRKKFANPTP